MSYDLLGGNADYELDFGNDMDFTFDMSGGARQGKKNSRSPRRGKTKSPKRKSKSPKRKSKSPKRKSKSPKRKGRGRSPSRSPRRRSTSRGQGRGVRKASYVSGKASRMGLLKKPRLKFDSKKGMYVPKERRGRSGVNVFISEYSKKHGVSGPALMVQGNRAWKQLSVSDKARYETKARSLGLKPAAHSRAVPKRAASKLRRSPRRKSPKSPKRKSKSQKGAGFFDWFTGNATPSTISYDAMEDMMDEGSETDFLF